MASIFATLWRAAEAASSGETVSLRGAGGLETGTFKLFFSGSGFGWLGFDAADAVLRILPH